jgi:hypothetical protein
MNPPLIMMGNRTRLMTKLLALTAARYSRIAMTIVFLKTDPLVGTADERR